MARTSELRARYGSVLVPTGKRDTTIGLPNPAEGAPKVLLRHDAQEARASNITD
ncbi:predicted protein [Pyrenophora tritici-repentis Pt-1C-BFP]|uniref:Uncharacterized protein n=1 Tax=Pyrenophora tritici-repentis (strain Pt-1C-BFP) TaxID=426418 RepID=B2VQZ1_PYRTR|nr:uncharacterized protein PTRG_00588 [Pyrenophora tritici-repentis Pt-1C-BFP]EDU40026.1 predicted protein [Pyrenophora tritici-repentis Pt-1C-BFP]